MTARQACPAISLQAPGSKSQTQRALMLAALASGESRVHAPLDCDDSRYLRRALQRLGVGLRLEHGLWRVSGVGGRPRATQEPLDCGEGGTTLRFLAPLSLLLNPPGAELLLEGRGQLIKRPMTEMIQALQGLGISARSLQPGRTLPLSLQLQQGPGRQVFVDASRSSQFISGLLMAGPCLGSGLVLEVASEMVSWPYVELTLAAMEAFGVTARQQGNTFTVPPGAYQAADFTVEGDWSAAAFLLVAGRITQRAMDLPNLLQDSQQGDRAISGFLNQLDSPGPHRFHLQHCPDLIAPLAVACALAADHPAEITGAAHVQHKESARLSVLARGLEQVGVRVEERADGLALWPARSPLRPARLDPQGDHRMAMAFGLLSLLEPGIEVMGPECVSKSYQGFWEDLELFK